MESLGTKEAARRLRVTVSRLHKLTAARGINPVFQASGRTGEKFWNPADIERLAATLDNEQVAS